MIAGKENSLGTRWIGLDAKVTASTAPISRIDRQGCLARLHPHGKADLEQHFDEVQVGDVVEIARTPMLNRHDLRFSAHPLRPRKLL